MFPLLTGLITGGAGLLGSIFSSQTSAQNSQLAAQTAQQNNAQQIAAQEQMLNQTEDFNAEQAQQNRQFTSSEAAVQRGYETQMSNTAYQRASADMKAAGLNPAMMFGSGGASSTPSVSAASGSSASVGTPTVPQAQFAPPQQANPWANVGDVVSKAVGSATQAATIEKMTQEIANLQTQQVKTAAETVTEEKKPALAQSQTELNVQDMWKKAQETATINAKMPQAVFEGTVAKDLLSMPDWLRSKTVQGGFVGNRISDAIAPLVNTAGAVSKFMPRF